MPAGEHDSIVIRKGSRMMRIRSDRLMAVVCAGAFALGGAAGCVAPEADEKAGADRSDGDRGTLHDGSDRGEVGGGANDPGRRGDGSAACAGNSRGSKADRAIEVDARGDREGPIQGMSDGELAGLISALNERTIALSNRALGRIRSGDVQRHAEEVVREHTRAAQREAALFRNAGLTPGQGDPGRWLDAGPGQPGDPLQGQEGANLERAYLRAEIDMHRRALQHLDASLVAGTKNAPLRAEIEAVRATEERHLTRAEQLYCALL
jgi:putative membrane protein